MEMATCQLRLMAEMEVVDNREATMVAQCAALRRRKPINATVSAAPQRGRNNIKWCQSPYSDLNECDTDATALRIYFIPLAGC
jgi:hypothetical protein